MAKKYFGTDGIRGRVGKGQMTPQAVMKLGWAVGKVLASHGNNLVVIGKDTRISGYMFEASLEAGLSAAGVECADFRSYANAGYRLPDSHASGRQPGL